MTLSGGGTLSMSPSGNNFITDSGGTSTLTNINNTISAPARSAITIYDLTLNNSGTIDGNGGGLFLSNIRSAVNGGTLEAIDRQWRPRHRRRIRPTRKR